MDKVRISAKVGGEFEATVEVDRGQHAWHFVVVFSIRSDDGFLVGKQRFQNEDVAAFSDPMCIACKQNYTPEIGMLPCPMT
jgi:hypothetical protein